MTHVFDPVTQYCCRCGAAAGSVRSRGPCAVGNVVGIAHMRAQARLSDAGAAMIAEILAEDKPPMRILSESPFGNKPTSPSVK